MPKNQENGERKGALGRLKDKIMSVSGIITGLCAITAFLWTIFREVQSYKNSKISEQEQTIIIDSLTTKVAKLEKKVDSLSTSRKLDIFDMGVAYEIVVKNMPDYYYEGIRFKTSNDGKELYYYVNGILYRAGWDAQNYKYYYINEQGKTFWCK